MNDLLRTLPGLAAVMLLGASAQAHPGHGASQPGPLHYVSEPVHAVWLSIPVLMAAGAALAVIYRRRQSARARVG